MENETRRAPRSLFSRQGSGKEGCMCRISIYHGLISLRLTCIQTECSHLSLSSRRRANTRLVVEDRSGAEAERKKRRDLVPSEEEHTPSIDLVEQEVRVQISKSPSMTSVRELNPRFRWGVDSLFNHVRLSFLLPHLLLLVSTPTCYPRSQSLSL